MDFLLGFIGGALLAAFVTRWVCKEFWCEPKGQD
jgi:hypothetical protein